MVRVLLPSELIDFWTVALDPVPTATRMMTAATPMRIPDIVSSERSLFASTPRTANRALSRMFTTSPPPARRRGGGPSGPATRTSDRTRPSRIRTTRFARSATSSSWVITTSVRPAEFRSSNSSSTSAVLGLSSAPVGSSASSSTGSVTIARAIATRCCWPPDSS